jgi:hypothetical protein
LLKIFQYEKFGTNQPDRHYQTIEKAEMYFNAWNDCLEKGLKTDETNEILSKFDELPERSIKNSV